MFNPLNRIVLGSSLPGKREALISRMSDTDVNGDPCVRITLVIDNELVGPGHVCSPCDPPAVYETAKVIFHFLNHGSPESVLASQPYQGQRIHQYMSAIELFR